MILLVTAETEDVLHARTTPAGRDGALVDLEVRRFAGRE
jgi:hypothetical protein